MCVHGLLGGGYLRALWCVSTLLKPLALCCFGDFSGFLPQLREDLLFWLIEWSRSDPELYGKHVKWFVANWNRKTSYGIKLKGKIAKRRNKQEGTYVRSSQSTTLLPSQSGEQGAVSEENLVLTEGQEYRSLYFSQAKLRRWTHRRPGGLFPRLQAPVGPYLAPK